MDNLARWIIIGPLAAGVILFLVAVALFYGPGWVREIRRSRREHWEARAKSHLSNRVRQGGAL